MQDFKVSGTGTMNGGEYGAVSINGSAKCTGDIKAELLDIDGSFKCEGAAEVDVLDCDGMAKFGGSVAAKKIDVDGWISVKGDRIEAEEIYCDGLIEADGQISADLLRADGCVRAREVVGDKVMIKSQMNRVVKFFRKHSEVGLIEATTIELKGVSAKTVNGRDITVGAGCEIKKLDCSGTLTVHPKAKVDEITGEYTKKSE